jgi:hypothetical protein
MKGKYINEIDFPAFRAIFSGQPIESIKPLRWHNNNASELLYFNHTIRKKVNRVTNIYERMKACFLLPDGKPFTANFKNLFQTIDINLSQDKQDAIDELVKNL